MKSPAAAPARRAPSGEPRLDEAEPLNTLDPALWEGAANPGMPRSVAMPDRVEVPVADARGSAVPTKLALTYGPGEHDQSSENQT